MERRAEAHESPYRAGPVAIAVSISVRTRETFAESIVKQTKKNHWETTDLLSVRLWVWFPVPFFYFFTFVLAFGRLNIATGQSERRKAQKQNSVRFFS